VGESILDQDELIDRFHRSLGFGGAAGDSHQTLEFSTRTTCVKNTVEFRHIPENI
jgi:hypothetical protein